MRGAAWRWPGIVLLGLFACAAIVSGADRHARIDPAAAALVPEGMAAASAGVAAKTALQAGDAQLAERFARRAVRSAPLDPGALSLLAQASLAQEDFAAAGSAFGHAAQLGWRQAEAQAYAFEQAVAGGDARRAALHLDALLRITGGDGRVRAGIDRLLAMESGQAALLERLETGPRWRSAVVGDVERLGERDLEARIALVAEALERGLVTCPEARALLASGRGVGLEVPDCPAR